MVELFTKVGYTFGGIELNTQAGVQAHGEPRPVFVNFPANEISARYRIGLHLDGSIFA